MAIYTTAETRRVLRVSDSTIKRMLKNGLIKANKVGGQYRILGKEILRLVSPELEKEAVKTYLSLKSKAGISLTNGKLYQSINAHVPANPY